jgi:hypothetical protein
VKLESAPVDVNEVSFQVGVTISPWPTDFRVVQVGRMACLTLAQISIAMAESMLFADEPLTLLWQNE